MKKIYPLIILFAYISCGQQKKNFPAVDPDQMMVRIAKLEIVPEHLQDYLSILTEEAKKSIEVEQGVISIFPMFKKENPTQITIVEIYANKEAYEAHLKTPHFKKYKSSTLEMVKSLELIDMDAIDPRTMSLIFEKFK